MRGPATAATSLLSILYCLLLTSAAAAYATSSASQNTPSLLKSRLEKTETHLRLIHRLIASIVCKDSGNTVLTTGAWCLFPDPSGALLEPGRPLASHHVFADEGLAHYISQTLGAASLLDLGAGIGQYGVWLKNNNASVSWTGFDGAINVEEFTAGFVHWADFSLPLLEKPRDWVMSLEVGEHIPAQYEAQLFDTLTSLNKCGVLLSWAVPGQGGHQHVNEKSNEYVIDAMTSRGYTYDEAASAAGREASGYSWFKNTLMVFINDDAPSSCKAHAGRRAV